MPRSSPCSLGALVGRTPLLRLEFKPEGVVLLGKCEFLNPSGSIKDRFAHAVVEEAERAGRLGPDAVILECSSGNTGVALAMVGAARGHRVAIVISEAASRERRYLIEHFGAEVITFPGDDYRTGVELTRAMAARDARYFLPRQFENPLNARDHEEGTGREILAQIPGPIDAFVAGYGTGGTLAGVSRALRSGRPGARIFAMEPAEAAVLSGESPCCHQIEGVADGFIPALLEGVALDGTVKVRSAEAMAMAQRLAREFGLLVGTSSGANAAAALRVAAELGGAPTVVTLLCDRAERYFSTRLFARGGAAAACA
jgi:cysteine synthase